jgi:hypothetical protein
MKSIRSGTTCIIEMLVAYSQNFFIQSMVNNLETISCPMNNPPPRSFNREWKERWIV